VSGERDDDGVTTTPDVVVAGGGPAGLAAALALGRSGARVVLVERDRIEEGVSAEAAFDLGREGIAHYMAPHAFLPRGAKVLRERAGDVYDLLLGTGAFELPIARYQADVRPEDADLILLRPSAADRVGVTPGGTA
jgi:phytoene dehydrogenase-like protein